MIFFNKTTDKPVKNQIILSIKDDNKIGIELELNINTPNIGKTMGQLLYNIHSGNLQDSFVNMLVDFSTANPDYKSIIEDIIYSWLKYEKTNDSSPYISPTKVFNQ